MKTIKVIIGIIVAIVCISSCSYKTCPTYSRVDIEDEYLFI